MMALQPLGPKQARKLVSQFLGTAAVANMDPEYIEVWHRSDALPVAGDAFRTQLEQMGRPWGVRPGILFSESEFSRITQPTLFIWGESDVFGGRDLPPEIGVKPDQDTPSSSVASITMTRRPSIMNVPPPGRLLLVCMAARRLISIGTAGRRALESPLEGRAGFAGRAPNSLAYSLANCSPATRPNTGTLC